MNTRMNPSLSLQARHGAAWRQVPARTGAVVLLAAALLLAGCVSLPGAVPRTGSTAMPAAADTPLSTLVAASTPPSLAHLSGFQLMADGADALATRLALVAQARRSLDLQYYQIADDQAGRQLLQALHDAARRGVRVRLLVDDLHATELDRTLRRLDAGEHFEVRLFNPLPTRSGSILQRVLWSMHDFDRINRRMHNKLFIADGVLAVTGGRNIGDDYFMLGTEANFIDLDILASGAVVPELAELFDRFWNDAYAYPISSLVALPASPAAPAARGAAAVPSPSPAAIGDGIATQFEQGRLHLHFAQARVFADAPSKAVRADAGEQPGAAMSQSLELMRAASREVMIVSPYFVPGEGGLAMLQEARERGIEIAIMTNSLGATDEPLVYRGYRRYRIEMLKMGVRLAELKPEPGGMPYGQGRFGSSSLGRLHAKLAVVDGRWLLVGSLNMDRRSSRINTELMLAIDSPSLAAMATSMKAGLWTHGNYQLRLDPQRERIEWVAQDGLQTVVHAAEPHVDWFAQWGLRLMSLLVPEELL
jgi:cardiolipin synthase C